MLTIREAQKMMKSMFYERDRSRGLYATFTWLVEEIGELAEAILNQNKESIEEEIADVIAWTISLANLLEIDVEEAFKKKYQHNKETDTNEADKKEKTHPSFSSGTGY